MCLWLWCFFFLVDGGRNVSDLFDGFICTVLFKTVIWLNLFMKLKCYLQGCLCLLGVWCKWYVGVLILCDNKFTCEWIDRNQHFAVVWTANGFKSEDWWNIFKCVWVVGGHGGPTHCNRYIFEWLVYRGNSLRLNWIATMDILVLWYNYSSIYTRYIKTKWSIVQYTTHTVFIRFW